MADVWTAIIAVGSTAVGVLASTWAGARTHRLEREKFESEQRRLNVEANKATLERALLERENDALLKAKRDIEAMLIEQEKENISLVLSTRRTIYPQLLQLVYRIRNQVRNIKDAVVAIKKANEFADRIDAILRLTELCRGPGDDVYIVGLWQLTEDLYKYRAFISSKTFEKLHAFKRASQEIAAQVDRGLRDFEKYGFREKNFNNTLLDEMSQFIDDNWEKIYTLHSDIYLEINSYFNDSLERAGMPESERAGLLPEPIAKITGKFT